MKVSRILYLQRRAWLWRLATRRTKAQLSFDCCTTVLCLQLVMASSLTRNVVTLESRNIESAAGSAVGEKAGGPNGKSKTESKTTTFH